MHLPANPGPVIAAGWRCRRFTRASHALALCSSFSFFFYSSQTFSKGLLPQPQPLQQLREEHFIFLHRLRLLPRRRGRAHGCHRHPQPLHPLLGNAREPQHQAAGGPRQGELPAAILRKQKDLFFLNLPFHFELYIERSGWLISFQPLPPDVLWVIEFGGYNLFFCVCVLELHHSLNLPIGGESIPSRYPWLVPVSHFSVCGAIGDFPVASRLTSSCFSEEFGFSRGPVPHSQLWADVLNAMRCLTWHWMSVFRQPL